MSFRGWQRAMPFANPKIGLKFLYADSGVLLSFSQFFLFRTNCIPPAALDVLDIPAVPKSPVRDQAQEIER
jgi:hypothetical protein